MKKKLQYNDDYMRFLLSMRNPAPRINSKPVLGSGTPAGVQPPTWK